MDLLKKLFPFSFGIKKDVTKLVIAIIIYIVVGVVGGVVIGFLSGIAGIGIIFSILGALLDLWSLIGIVLSVLVFLDLLK